MDTGNRIYLLAMGASGQNKKKKALMKEYLSTEEKQAVEVLKKIKPEGAFNQMVVHRVTEGKVDTVRILFREIKQQIHGTKAGRMAEVLGAEAVAAVLLTPNI